MIDTRIVIGMIAVLISMVVMAIAGIGEQHRMDLFTESFEARSIQNGAAIFETHCQECHGLNGKGVAGRGPALNTRSFFEDRLAELNYQGTLESYVELTVAGGRPVQARDEFGALLYAQSMPTWGQQFGGPLRPDQVRDVTAYVLNFRGDAMSEEEVPIEEIDDPVQRGRAHFNQAGCSACHTVAGSSGGEVGPELTNLYEEQGEAYIRESILDPNAVIVEGFAANIMPQNFDELLTEEQVDDIITFLEDAAANN